MIGPAEAVVRVVRAPYKEVISMLPSKDLPSKDLPSPLPDMDVCSSPAGRTRQMHMLLQLLTNVSLCVVIPLI